jgi:hypothetical protein
MKQITTLIFSLFLVNLTLNANVFTVNNQSGFDADFNDLQNAVSTVSQNDTLYVEPSSISYGDISLNKKLYIIGPGHNPDFSPYVAQINTLILQNGSSSSIIKGINFGILAVNASSTINDIVVSGCYSYSSSILSISAQSTILNNWIFEGNVFIAAGSYLNLDGLGANLIFRNNYLQNVGTGVLFNNVPSGTVLDHNLLFLSDNPTANSTIISGYTNISITNNIFLYNTSSAAAPETGCQNCQWLNNITYGLSIPVSALPATNFNDVNPQFVNFTATGGVYSYLNNFQLSSNSIGNNAATDGTDIGLYGGIFPFSPIGADAGTPQIVDFTLGTSTAPSGGTITIHLNANGTGN